MNFLILSLALLSSPISSESIFPTERFTATSPCPGVDKITCARYTGLSLIGLGALSSFSSGILMLKASLDYGKSQHELSTSHLRADKENDAATILAGVAIGSFVIGLIVCLTYGSN